MDAVRENGRIYWSICRKLKKLTHLTRNPEFVCCRIQLPNSEMRRIGCQSNPLFKFVQSFLLFQRVRNVDAGADIPAEISASSKPRHSVVGDKAIFSVVAP